jgi:uroporphyrinogen-III synthase
MLKIIFLCVVMVVSLENVISFQRVIHSQQKICFALMRASENKKVALTRELGKNDKLKKMIDGSRHEYECVELPCVMFAPGKDLNRLGTELKPHDTIVITSPQSAGMLVKEWTKVGMPKIQVVSVGSGTSKVLTAAGINPVFEPSESTAKVLAAEMPLSLGGSVLYPTSNLARDTLQADLEARGIEVTRLHTYTTKPSIWSLEELRMAKDDVEIVAFASPSAVRTWAERVGTDYIAVVIGPTSAREAESLGFTQVVEPQGSKGLDAWANLIKDTVKKSMR